MESEKLLPPGEIAVSQNTAPSTLPPGVPSPKAQQWGTVISIIIIVLMIIVGAFYSWGKRIAEEKALIVPIGQQL